MVLSAEALKLQTGRILALLGLGAAHRWASWSAMSRACSVCVVKIIPDVRLWALGDLSTFLSHQPLAAGYPEVRCSD